MQWHTLTIDELYRLLKTSEKGLSRQDAIARLREYGPNQLRLQSEPLWKVIIEPFRSVFVGVLLLAAFISLISHELLDSIIISSIILVNSLIYYVQQYTTNRVMRSLRKQTNQKTEVIRDGKIQSVSSLELVPGDILILSEGGRIPADARLVRSDNLQTDESSLTGESLPVHKIVSTLPSDKPISEQHNMVFQGSYTLSGSGRAVVVATGLQTEFGRIADLATQKKDRSPVQQKIDHVISRIIAVVGVVALVVFLLGIARGMAASEALRFVLSMSVSAVPEGLPVALTIIMVLGMRRMAKQKALVRSLKAIEDIGLITTIATDKTGTLTKNHLTVVDSWAPGKSNIVGVAARTIDPHEGFTDPLDTALKEFIHQKRVVQADRFYPFDLTIRMSGGYYLAEKTLYIKGSPEHVLDCSSLTKLQRSKAESVMHSFASKGFRVIAFANKRTPKAPENLQAESRAGFNFIGFLAFADELRPEARRSVEQALDAGISVKMITGDHFETAYHIGQSLGLSNHKDQVITGADLPKDDKVLAETVQSKTVFARILPEDKFRILQALKQTQITAMTGDGVNDVPALANAHVGIAMGSGNDIAKDAGGIVLLNDNFATIIKALGEGRKIFDNIRRMLYYLLSTSLGEVLTMIGALLLDLPLPVTAIQILWINLVTDTVLVIPLGMEHAEEGHMKQPPRKPDAPILSRNMITRMIAIAATMAFVTLAIVWTLDKRGYSAPYIQTIAFMSLIAAQWMNAFNARGHKQSLLKRLKRPNHAMTVGLLIAIALQSVVMFGPLKEVFEIQTVNPLLLIASVAYMIFSIFAVAELHKYILRRQDIKQSLATKH